MEYVGIDLGTTNSAIASYDGEDVALYKSPEQHDVTPSAIFIDRRGNKFVGSRAYANAARNPDNAATLFKRMMGTNTPIQLPAVDKVMTPEECSAEVLRTVFGYLPETMRRDGDTGTVITVPAAFNSKVDEKWVERLRAWLGKQPVVSSSGTTCEQPRSLSTIENSVIQLAAAINASHGRGDNSQPAQFKPIPTKELNRTPTRRLTISELADAFKYAIDPRYPTKRLGLHRFLMFSVGTAARPDAAHDFSTDPARRQWNSERRVIALNPAARRQTKKRRAVVVAPRQLAARIDEVSGHFVPFISVKSAWETMVAALGWPTDGEGGMKLVRRSIAQLLRDTGTPRAWSPKYRKPSKKVSSEQIEVQLGHRVIDSVSDLYAIFDADYQHEATLALEAIIDELERLCPGAFGG